MAGSVAFGLAAWREWGQGEWGRQAGRQACAQARNACVPAVPRGAGSQLAVTGWEMPVSEVLQGINDPGAPCAALPRRAFRTTACGAQRPLPSRLHCTPRARERESQEEGGGRGTSCAAKTACGGAMPTPGCSASRPFLLLATLPYLLPFPFLSFLPFLQSCCAPCWRPCPTRCRRRGGPRAPPEPKPQP